MNPEKKVIPLPLIILFLIIIFFSCLIISAWYFQSKLQELNSGSENQISSIKIKKSIIIGIEPDIRFNNYIIDLSASLAKDLGAEIEIKYILKKNILNALDQKQVDLIISSNLLDDEIYQNYIISNSITNINNNDFRILFRKEDKILMQKIDYTLQGLKLKGTITDLNQKWLD